MNEFVLLQHKYYMCSAHIGGLIQAEWHVLKRNIGLKIDLKVNR